MPIAMDSKRASHFAGRKGPAMEAKTVAILTGGESVVKNPRQVLCGNTDPIVDHRNPDTILDATYSEGHALVRQSRFITRVLRVADQIHQNLQYFVLVRADGGKFVRVFTDKLHAILR